MRRRVSSPVLRTISVPHLRWVGPHADRRSSALCVRRVLRVIEFAREQLAARAATLEEAFSSADKGLCGSTGKAYKAAALSNRVTASIALLTDRVPHDPGGEARVHFRLILVAQQC
jgi:hypothetical protein